MILIYPLFQANYNKERLKQINREIEECSLPKATGLYRGQVPLSPRLSAKSDGHRSLQHYKSLPQLNQATEEDRVSNIYILC